MAALSVSRAWDEGTRFAAREFRLLYPVALLLLELPVLLAVLIAPAAEMTDVANMADLRAIVENIGVGTFVLIFVLLGLLVFALQTLGGLTISLLALRPGTSVGEALAIAARRLPAVLGAVLLLALAFAILMAPAWLLLIGSSGGQPSIQGGVGFFFLFLLLLIIVIVIGTRLALLNPVGVAEPLGPIGVIRRSWSLTGGHFWKLLGTFLLIGIVYLILSFVVTLVLGLFTLAVVGQPEVDTTAGFVFQLLSSLFTAAIAVFFIAFVARIYAQLSGQVEETGRVFT